jgi:hypothetical protein
MLASALYLLLLGIIVILAVALGVVILYKLIKGLFSQSRLKRAICAILLGFPLTLIFGFAGLLFMMFLTLIVILIKD